MRIAHAEALHGGGRKKYADGTEGCCGCFHPLRVADPDTTCAESLRHLPAQGILEGLGRDLSPLRF